MRFTLTAGQRGDAPQAADLIEGLPAEVVTADAAYDADHLRQAIAAKRAPSFQTTLPARSSHLLDKHHYGPSAISSNAASQSSNNSGALQLASIKAAQNYQAMVTLASRLSEQLAAFSIQDAAHVYARAFRLSDQKVATLILVEAMSDKPARFVRLAGGRCFLAKTLDCTPVRRVGWSYVGNVAVGTRDDGLPLEVVWTLSHP